MAEEGAVTVCVRVRPLIAREKEEKEKEVLYWKSEDNTISEVNGTKVFSYDRVFHSSDNTQQLYEGVAVPIIQSAVQGYNGTIFAYGQTASGKTYTMMGSEDSAGIIPRAVQHVFKIICEIPDREFLLRVSYMEIYNETITDLLCDTRKKKPLAIREDVNRNIYVEDLIEEVVVAPEQVMEWIRKGEKNRHYGETKMNEHSSRSHTIFRMIIESRERSDPVNANCDGAVMVSHLNLVDLAGSERASQTGSEGVRLKEGCNINRSLFILGQVIKKLCDDPSGFINYRDSKLTRILQNSLGGNAKTLIICTITPVSFDVTLGTLQFANTAKRMKNTPKVNEVLDDDALLKRYRKEILDLKKQLEEVSSKTQIHAMEKDQLAQLLEEKNSLQKVQEDRIRNLTEMLVTSASFSSKQNSKAKIRRRVTWAPGKINQANVSCFEDFEKPRLSETEKKKRSLTLPQVEYSLLENSERDNQYLTFPIQMSDVEWTAGPNMNWTQKDFEESVQLCEALALEKDIAVNEVNILQTNFDNLVLENERLKLEINEMKEKLKEKMETDEFEALEKQTQKEHEEEINSKLEELKEKENKIKVLQNRVEELQKAEAEKKDTFISVGNPDKLIKEIQQLNKSLSDSENIALDAKRESAFLRTENLELKEKMNELLNNYEQMQKDIQVYKNQIEAGKASYKKMQTDLQKELQSVFQENARLTSMMDGKVPKDLLSFAEVEKKVADLKGELEKALKENAFLQKQVNELVEFQSLPNTVEMQQKEILEKCEELRLLKLEREKLLSEVADNEARLKCMAEEIKKSQEDLADAQLKYVTSDQEYVALKQLHEELEQKYVAASENNEQMKLQIDVLSKAAQESKTALNEVKFELSSKMKELEEKTAEYKQLLEVREDFSQTQQKLNETEQLKEQDKVMEVKDSEIQAVLQQLIECQEEIKTLTQERDYLKQKEESLQAETDQLKEDIKDTVSMNILAHEELRNTQSSLKQSQDTVKKLEINISEKESQILSVEKTLGKTIKELKIQLTEATENLTCVSSEYSKLLAEKNQIELIINENVSQQLEKITLLNQEKDELRQMVEACKAERDQLEADCQESKEQVVKLNENLNLVTKEKHELLEELKEKTENERIKLQQLEKQCDLLAQERHQLQEMLGGLQSEKNKLEIKLQESVDKILESEKQLKWQQELFNNEKIKAEEREEHLLKVQRRSDVLEDSLTSKIQQLTEALNIISCEKDQLLAERISHSSQHKEQISSINREKDELQKLLQDVTSERDQLKTELQKNSEMYVETNAKLESALEQQKQRSLNDMSIQVNSLGNTEQMFDDSLKKNLKIKELLEKFPSIGKRYECLSTVSLKLRNDLDSQKALVAVIMTLLSPEEGKQVRRLQYENEKRNGLLQSLLNKLKFLFSRVCSKKCNYYSTVNKYEIELLEEKRKQDQLQAQIQCLRKIYLNQNETSSQELNISEALQSLQLDAESILKDVSEMESELIWIEAELQQEECARKETTQFWEACSGTHFNVEKLIEELKKDNGRLSQVHGFWTPKVKVLLELSSELDARTASYSKSADVELKQRKEKSEELFQELNTLKEQLAPGASASHALEENYRLHNKLKAAEQDRKDMEIKIQNLENVINEVGKEVKERDDRISKLQADIRIKSAASEGTQLQVKLDETEKSLKTALTEIQSLQAKLDKDAMLYKEEIEHLKTELVKYDMERMKQSKCFEIKLANYKAILEQKEHQLRDFKEELRRAHQEKDVTVLQETEAPWQSQTPITCGGGSGIVQSTQILVLKSEQAKLQKENLHLKKQSDLLLSNERQLKEELRKWKERALKWREKSLSEHTREKVPRSPKTTVSSSLKEQMPPPSKEPVSQETVTRDTSTSLPPPFPTSFFDNSGLSKLIGLQPAGIEPSEEHVERWFRTPEKENALDCTTQ
ncbi:centromere-associated protein E isoform X2 [Cuculus canorus]|uniref:centromere-associated protein E isoform X2 n=1 Tax=Cuculus canorus TaxID=55661 RepID=UPI0023AA5D06|nr:centromere-associated protein E isoform X2 [Cuculus canorus]